MKKKKINAASGRGHRPDWLDKRPSKKYRVFVRDAITVVGNANALAKLLGITRSAVYQWRPPYRHDPFMPEDMAKRLLDENPDIRKELEEL